MNELALADSSATKHRVLRLMEKGSMPSAADMT